MDLSSIIGGRSPIIPDVAFLDFEGEGEGGGPRSCDGRWHKTISFVCKSTTIAGVLLTPAISRNYTMMYWRLYNDYTMMMYNECLD